MRKVVFLIVLIGLFALSVFRNNSAISPAVFKSKSSILSSCYGHQNEENHYHTQLSITQDGEKIVIPKGLGIQGDCIHPIHTHDQTGLIHMEYPKSIKFYLGDFFDVMGLIFNDRQIGTIKTSDGYEIQVKLNKKVVKSNYRSIVLKDREKIDISITSKH